MLWPTAVLAALTLLIGVGAGPLYDFSDRAAADLLDPTAYREAVLRAMRVDRLFAAGLATIWVLLWGSASPANVHHRAGHRVAPRARGPRPAPARRGASSFRPVAIARLVWHVLVTIVTSNVCWSARCWRRATACARPSSACRCRGARTSCSRSSTTSSPCPPARCRSR